MVESNRFRLMHGIPIAIHKGVLIPRCFHRFKSICSDIQKRDTQGGERISATATGIIQTRDEETLIYFDNIYPRATSLWRPSQWYNFLLTNRSRDAVRAKIMNFVRPGGNSIPNIELRSTVAIKRDGGVFATFSVPCGYSKAEVNAMIQKNTEQVSSKWPTFFFNRVAAFPVKGVPWIEDLRRLPNNVIRVTFDGKALTEEELYSLFRRYGTIVDIKMNSEKDNIAIVKYRFLRGAICAKNCISGLSINGTVLHVKYEQIIPGHAIKNFFVNHPRISIPLLFAFLSVAAVLIFDPIREFMIEQKIVRVFPLSMNNYFLKKLMSFTYSTMSSVRHICGVGKTEPEKRQLSQEHVEKIDELKKWLEENNNTFVIVTGPRGSGKHELVMKHLLDSRSSVLYLDCNVLVKCRTDGKFLSTAAHQIGYFPIFAWLNFVTGLVDLGVQGLTGQKSGLSESKETKFRNMLNTAMISIRHIALKGFKSEKADSIKEEDYLQLCPENKPVIVIDGFSNKAEINGFVYKELAEWASMLMQMNIAHVIFLTESVAPNQLLAEALPNQVFKFITLSDASQESAKRYVLSHLNKKNYSDDKNVTDINAAFIKQIEDALIPIGGRMSDLQAFLRRINSGEEPQEALDKMVEQACEQITQIVLNESSDVIKTAQAWELICMLADKDSVLFRDIVFKPLFKSSPGAGLLELEKIGLITISRNRGVLQEIRPAKPLFKAAFSFLTKDMELSTILKTGYLLKLINFETSRINKWEEELRFLAKVSDQKLIKSRLDYLACKIDASVVVINRCEEEVKKMSKSSTI